MLVGFAPTLPSAGVDFTSRVDPAAKTHVAQSKIDTEATQTLFIAVIFLKGSDDRENSQAATPAARAIRAHEALCSSRGEVGRRAPDVRKTERGAFDSEHPRAATPANSLPLCRLHRQQLGVI